MAREVLTWSNSQLNNSRCNFNVPCLCSMFIFVCKRCDVCMTYNYMLRVALLDRIRGWFYYVFIRGYEGDLLSLSVIGDIPIRSSRKHSHLLTVTTFLPEKTLKK